MNTVISWGLSAIVPALPELSRETPGEETKEGESK